MKLLIKAFDWLMKPITTLTILMWACYVASYFIDNKAGSLVFILLGVFIGVITLATIAIIQAIKESKEIK